MYRVIALFLTSLAPQLLISQTNYGDCASAFRVTDFTEILEFQPINSGNITDSFNTEDCISFESLSTWLKLEVATAGNFFFTITPKATGDDIDFVVYQTSTINDCTERETIRCMASGESIGIDSSACSGETGLSEDETDTIENPGCSPTDNNFLADIECQAGDTYLILINNFTNSGVPFCIEFNGTALLTTTSVKDLDEDAAFKLYPNPAHSILNISLSKRSHIIITNQLGQKMMEHTTEVGEIDITSLPEGQYTVSVDGVTQSFIKI